MTGDESVSGPNIRGSDCPKGDIGVSNDDAHTGPICCRRTSTRSQHWFSRSPRLDGFMTFRSRHSYREPSDDRLVALRPIRRQALSWAKRFGSSKSELWNHNFTACFRESEESRRHIMPFCTVFLMAEIMECRQASILPVVVGRVVLPSQAPPYASAHQLVARAVHGVQVQRLRPGIVVYDPMP
jgi:hypothetical protein